MQWHKCYKEASKLLDRGIWDEKLGTFKIFLRRWVTQSKKGLFLWKQILDLLAETNNSTYKLMDTSIKMNHGLAFYLH